jgi:hypothetical protein
MQQKIGAINFVDECDHKSKECENADRPIMVCNHFNDVRFIYSPEHTQNQQMRSVIPPNTILQFSANNQIKNIPDTGKRNHPFDALVAELHHYPECNIETTDCDDIPRMSYNRKSINNSNNNIFQRIDIAFRSVEHPVDQSYDCIRNQ